MPPRAFRPDFGRIPGPAQLTGRGAQCQLFSRHMGSGIKKSKARAVPRLRRAVAAEDVTALTRVPGIGRKGAQRIVLELAGRLGAPGMGGGPGRPGPAARSVPCGRRAAPA